MRLLLFGVTIGACLVFAGAAASAASFSDALGDANTPADVGAVTLTEQAGTITVVVDVANVRTLPANGSLTLWFDADANPGTGSTDGREARIRYEADGAVGLQVWNGTRLVERSPAGISAAFADGRLTLDAPASALGIAGPFTLAVVSGREQPAGNGVFLSTDLAPDAGVLSYPGSGVASLVDKTGDNESAPDVGAVDVTDGADGWVGIAVTIPNVGALPRVPLVGVSIDADDDPKTGDSGADLAITVLGQEIVADRWSARGKTWIPDEGARVRVTQTPDGVVVGVQTSELGAAPRFGFAVVAAGVAGTSFTGVDVAPDGTPFYRYAFQNRPAVRLVAGKARTFPARPRAGGRVVVGATVTRSDTSSPPRAGAVTCRASVDGRRVSAVGQYAAGRASCSFDVPRSARRAVGTMAVRGDGITTIIPFSFPLR